MSFQNYIRIGSPWINKHLAFNLLYRALILKIVSLSTLKHPKQMVLEGLAITTQLSEGLTMTTQLIEGLSMTTQLTEWLDSWILMKSCQIAQQVLKTILSYFYHVKGGLQFRGLNAHFRFPAKGICNHPVLLK